LESVQVPRQGGEDDKKWKFIKEHVAVSELIASDIPSYESAKFKLIIKTKRIV
jgi:hypothetical protein